MAVILLAIVRRHLQVHQLLTSLLQARNGRVLLDMVVLQVVEPLLDGRPRHIVELIDAD